MKKEALYSKRAQAAVFMLIGLVMLITAGVFYFVLDEEAAEQSAQDIPNVPSQVGSQTELKTYVDDCLQDSVLQGLEIMRLQAGHIEIPSGFSSLEVIDEESKAVDPSQKRVSTLENVENNVPYWLMVEEAAIPSLNYLEDQLSSYVREKVLECVDDFRPFSAQGYDVKTGNIDVETTMDVATSVSVSYPVTLTKEDLILEENDFIYSVPINFQALHQVSTDLATLESYHGFVEDHTTHIISLYSGVDASLLPPFYQSVTNFDCNFESWSKNAVKEKLKTTLAATMSDLKIEGTQYTLPTGTELDAVYESFVYDLLPYTDENIIVEFEYRPEWEFFEFDILPSNGDQLIPDRVVGTNLPLIPKICVFNYPFKYSMEYPVLVTITDTQSSRIDPDSNVLYEGEGFSFQFPMITSICGNNERNCVESEIVSASIGEDPEKDDINLFCDYDQRISDEVTFVVTDKDSSPVPNADVNFICGISSNNCFIGRTGSDGRLSTKLPNCVNGIVSVSKSGFSSQTSLLSTTSLPLEKSVVLGPRKNFNVNLYKLLVKDIVKNYAEGNALSKDSLVLQLDDKEQASIIGDSGVFYLYPDPGSRQMELGLERQTFSIQLNGPIDTSNLDLGGNSIKGIKGNYPIGSSSVTFEATLEDLQKNNVVFYVVSEYEKGLDQDVVLDPYLKEDGTIEAEVLWQCNVDPVCDLEDCFVVEISGASRTDLTANEEACQKTEKITISRSDYQELMEPDFV